MIKRIKRILRNPSRILEYLIGQRCISRFFSDKTYISLKYRLVFGKKLDLENPKTYNEKLQWLKLYNRKDEYTTMVDKFAVREYVANKIGEEYLIPSLGVWDNPEDINFDELPDEFVLKCNHNSGVGMCICKDKSKLDIEKVKKELKKGLEQDYYMTNREWPYKNVPRKIIAEKFMVDESGTELKDYKFFCFDGKPHFLFIATDRNTPGEETKFDFFDMDFNHLDFTNGHPNSDKTIEKPKGFEEMKELACKLSEGLPHARIDFYDINGQVYFGEITFFHWSGIVPFNPEEWDYKFGELINLKTE